MSRLGITEARRGAVETMAVLWVLVAALTYVVTGLGSASVNQVVIAALVNLIWVVGLYLFSGVSGIFSLGQLGFAAVSAYVTAVLSISPATKKVLMAAMPAALQQAHTSTLLAVIIGVAVAGVLAVLTAVPVMRLSGLTAALGTFILLAIVYSVATNWRSVTGGTSGITGLNITTTKFDCLIGALLAIGVAAMFQSSRTGLRLRATREDEVAARAAGIGVTTERSAAWILSAIVTGLGGALYAGFVGTFNSDSFSFDPTFLILAMLIVGGMRSLSGAVIGTVFLSAVSKLLDDLEQGVHVAGASITLPAGAPQVGLGLILLVTLLLRPEGVLGDHELRLPRWRRGSSSQPGATTGDGSPREAREATVATHQGEGVG